MSSHGVRVETHRDGVIMFENIAPEQYEAIEHAAREEGVSVEDYMRELIDTGFRKLAEDAARERGITVEQFMAEVHQQPYPFEDWEVER